jgi:hypothetical protein
MAGEAFLQIDRRHKTALLTYGMQQYAQPFAYPHDCAER